MIEVLREFARSVMDEGDVKRPVLSDSDTL